MALRIERAARKSPRDGWHDGDVADVSKACSAFIFRVKCRALQQHRWDKLKFHSKRGFLALRVTAKLGPSKTHERERERERKREKERERRSYSEGFRFLNEQTYEHAARLERFHSCFSTGLNTSTFHRSLQHYKSNFPPAATVYKYSTIRCNRNILYLPDCSFNSIDTLRVLDNSKFRHTPCDTNVLLSA